MDVDDPASNPQASPPIPSPPPIPAPPQTPPSCEHLSDSNNTQSITDATATDTDVAQPTQEPEAHSERVDEVECEDSTTAVAPIDAASIHNLSVQDAVTHIEIEHDDEESKHEKQIVENDNNNENEIALAVAEQINGEEIIENTHEQQTFEQEEGEDLLQPLPVAPLPDADNEQEDKETASTAEHADQETEADTTTTTTTATSTSSSSSSGKKRSRRRRSRSSRKTTEKADQEDEEEEEEQGEDEEHDDPQEQEHAQEAQSTKTTPEVEADDEDNFDANAPCGVCWGSSSFDDDVLVYCDGCNVPLHQMCYLIPQIPEQDYYCKVCAYQMRTTGQPPSNKDWSGRKCKCSICQLRFRSKKLAYASQKMDDETSTALAAAAGSPLATKQKWCHLICAQFVSETWFDEHGAELDGVCNVEGIRQKRGEGQCGFCGREKGAKVFCSIMGCGARFHASCGLVNGCMLQDVAEPDAEFSNRVVYCRAHLPSLIRNGHNAMDKKKLADSQDVRTNGNQNNLGWGDIWDKRLQQQHLEYERQHKPKEKALKSAAAAPKKKRGRPRKKKLVVVQHSCSEDTDFEMAEHVVGGAAEEEDAEEGDDAGYTPNDDETAGPRSVRKRRSSRKKTTTTAGTGTGKKRGRKPKKKKVVDSEEEGTTTTTTTQPPPPMLPMAAQPPMMHISEPPPLAPVFNKRRGFFGGKSTGPRSMGAGPGQGQGGGGARAKKKFASNHKKRKEAPDNEDVQPPSKKQRVAAPPNPNLIPKRTMPKYTAAPTVLPSARNNNLISSASWVYNNASASRSNNASNNATKSAAVKELIARSEAKKFEQHGKVRFIKPTLPVQTFAQRKQQQQQQQLSQPSPLNVPPPPNGHYALQHHQPVHSAHHTLASAVPPPPQAHVHHLHPHAHAHPGASSVFPPRPNEIWSTRMLHKQERSPSGTDILDLDFKVTFVWRAGCRMEWPFENVSNADVDHSRPVEPINCAWKKGFAEIEKYMSEIRPGGKKQHLSHHWMMCEVHPYSTDDVPSYADFCNYYKDLRKVSAAMCKSNKHQHLLFYLCPPDEQVLSEQYLDDVFNCTIPKGLMWCLIFIKHLDDKQPPQQQHTSATTTLNNTVSMSSASKTAAAAAAAVSVMHAADTSQTKTSGSSSKDPRVKDPRRREKKNSELQAEHSRDKKHKDKEKRKAEKEKKKEKREQKEQAKEKEKEASVSLSLDAGNLLGQLDKLEDTLKDEAGLIGQDDEAQSTHMDVDQAVETETVEKQQPQQEMSNVEKQGTNEDDWDQIILTESQEF